MEAIQIKSASAHPLFHRNKIVPYEWKEKVNQASIVVVNHDYDYFVAKNKMKEFFEKLWSYFRDTTAIQFTQKYISKVWKFPPTVELLYQKSLVSLHMHSLRFFIIQFCLLQLGEFIYYLSIQNFTAGIFIIPAISFLGSLLLFVLSFLPLLQNPFFAFTLSTSFIYFIYLLLFIQSVFLGYNIESKHIMMIIAVHSLCPINNHYNLFSASVVSLITVIIASIFDLNTNAYLFMGRVVAIVSLSGLCFVVYLCLQTFFRKSFLTQYIVDLKNAKMKSDQELNETLLANVLPKEIIQFIRGENQSSNLYSIYNTTGESSANLMEAQRKEKSELSIAKEIVSNAMQQNHEKEISIRKGGVHLPNGIELSGLSIKVNRFFPEATIMFIDIVDFTFVVYSSFLQKNICLLFLKSKMTMFFKAWKIVSLLSEVFHELDTIVEKRNLYRIKTISSVYMIASGFPSERQTHIQEAIDCGLDILESAKAKKLGIAYLDQPAELKIGLNSGGLCAGIVGLTAVQYDALGDTVNVGSRMMYYGSPHTIMMPQTVYDKMKHLNYHVVNSEGQVFDIKGKGPMRCYLIAPKPKPPTEKKEETSNTQENMEEDPVSSNQVSTSNHIVMIRDRFSKIEEIPPVDPNAVSPPDIIDFLSQHIETKEVVEISPNTESEFDSIFPHKEITSYVSKETAKLFTVNFWKVMNPFLQIYYQHPFNLLYMNRFYKLLVWPTRVLFTSSIFMYLVSFIIEMLMLGNTLNNRIDFIGSEAYWTSIQVISITKLGIAFPALCMLLIISFTPLLSIHAAAFELIGYLIFFFITTSNFITQIASYYTNYFAYFQFAWLNVLIASQIGLYFWIRILLLLCNFICYILILTLFQFSISNYVILIPYFVTTLNCLFICWVVNSKLKIDFYSRAVAAKKTDMLRFEVDKTEELLENTLPKKLILDLKRGTLTKASAEYYEESAIMFADIVQFTILSSKMSSIDLIKILNEIFTTFDYYAKENELQRIQLVGDCYKVCSLVGLSTMDGKNHLTKMGFMALKMIDYIATYTRAPIKVRVGIASGPLVAGIVVGYKRLTFDIYGITVDKANFMESSGATMRIQCNSDFCDKVKPFNRFIFEERKNTEGLVYPKTREVVKSFWLLGEQKET